MAPRTDDDPHTLGRAIRALRDRAGITQKVLAERVGTSEAYVSNIEGGRRDARWSTVIRLLHSLDADLHQLADAIAEVEEQERRPKR
ncbi:MAG TPA: helix-turn-helix transcriptional regulator [Solirubrobacteraceae bacterium]|nr:helix-turn-helix transcriptional regulator [Solirubrobacteraceae bacterium]